MQCMHKWHLHIILHLYYIYISRIDISVYCLTFGPCPWNLQPIFALFETPPLVLKYEGLDFYCWQVALVPSSVVLIISRSSLTFVRLSTSTCNKSGVRIKRHTKLHPHTEFPFFLLLHPQIYRHTFLGTNIFPPSRHFWRWWHFPLSVW